MEKTRSTAITSSVHSQTDLTDERMQYNFLRLDLHFETSCTLCKGIYQALEIKKKRQKKETYKNISMTIGWKSFLKIEHKSQP